VALTNEELEQIRSVVRSEIGQSRSVRNIVLIYFLVSAAMILAVLALHVLVIGGFTLYHLISSSG
jgi:uncharacterized membrane protein